MPNVPIKRDELFEALGENWGSQPGVENPAADKAFDELCFEFGIELDDVTSETTMQKKETGAVDAKASDDIIYVIAVPANRYDLLCLEGIVRALRVFMGKEKIANYHLTKPTQMQKMIIKKETAQIRQFVVCAVLRNMKFDQKNYKSFIDLQEKLHVNICRKRTLVSIGTHDLDTIKGPFTYEALPPKEIKFAPLNNPTEYDGEGLMNHLQNDLHLKPFLPIIRDSPVYPVIYDSERRVLSLPPIINGNHSKITLNTKNVFIEVTATDLTKAKIVLNTMCAMFAEYCEDKFSIEPVEVYNETTKETSITPDITERVVDAEINYIKKSVGIDVANEKVVELLSKMALNTKLSDDKKVVSVNVPITRSDIIHACDVMEDVGIAYGFNNLTKTPPATVTTGKQHNLNKVTDFFRKEIAMTGFTEILTLALCSREENFGNLLRPDDGSAVVLANPKSIEFQIARTSLLVGLLKTVHCNKQAPLPLKIFECSDIVLKNDKTDVGSINKRHLCAVFVDKISGTEVVHGLLDRLMLLNRVLWKTQVETELKPELEEKEKLIVKLKAIAKPTEDESKQTVDIERRIKQLKNLLTSSQYYLKPSNEPTYIAGQQAHVMLDDVKIGIIGVIHPQVLTKYDIPFPCAAFEIDIENFL